MTEKEAYKKGESLLERCGAIEKIGVYCYNVTVECHNIGEGTICEKSEDLIILGINEERLNERVEDQDNECEGYMESTYYKLKSSSKMLSSEVMERFNLKDHQIRKILDDKEIIEYDDFDIESEDLYRAATIKIDDLREERLIDAQPFDVEDIISKIASEYVLTPKRKGALIKSIHQFKG